MRKAYIVSIYNHIEYANRFISQLLADGTSDVFIHIDKKCEELKDSVIVNSKVHLIKNNHYIEWGGYSFLMAIIASWREVVEYGQFDYVFLCSGQDLMVRDKLDVFLMENPKKIFIDAWEDDKTRRAYLLYKWPSKYFRIIDTKISIIRLKRVLRIMLFRTGFPIGKRKIDFDTSKIVFYKNWFWSCLPFEVVQWILKYIEKNPNYLEVFKGFVAEEGFIATTIMLSPYKSWIEYDKEGKSHSLTYRKPSVNNHPPVITKKDIDDIEKSGCFFTRKVDDQIDKEVIDYFMKKGLC